MAPGREVPCAEDRIHQQAGQGLRLHRGHPGVHGEEAGGQATGHTAGHRWEAMYTVQFVHFTLYTSGEEGSDFTGVIDLVSMKAFTWRRGDGSMGGS